MSYRGYRQVNIGFGRGLTPVIKWLIIINAAIFLIQIIDKSGYVTRQLGLSTRDVLTVPAFWQVFTYQFTHGGFFHILFNMFILWMFGSEVEMTLGSRRFLKFYLLCGTGAGIITVMALFSVPTLVVGASGAIYGVMVAFAIMNPNRLVYLWFLIPIKVKYLVLILVGMDLLYTLSGGGGGVAYITHLGGALIGFLYMKSNWRMGALKSKITRLKSDLKYKKEKKQQESTDRLMEEVDEILDKISKVGYENLTEKEKKILERASDALSRRKD
ncbi:MAG: rhomboid family intramembrane serine protease [candidate division Zixibacteria bacterium]|nr:rhomboid family intramembrane serine protease [candidate division Zixibacteria bacterium]